MARLYSLLTLSILTISASAQWVPNTAINTLVANQATDDQHSVRGSDGSTYTAFWHNVTGGQYYEMRLQKLDANGVPQFGTNGMLVNGSIAMSSYIVTWDIAIDNSNNVYIGFTGTGTNTPAVVHKISPTGTQLWNASGVSIGSGYDVKLLPLSTGQLVVGYMPSTGTQASFTMLNSTGITAWTSQKNITPVTSGARTIVGEMAEISGSKFEIIHYEQSGFSPFGYPFAQCYNFSGTAQWTAPVALTSNLALQTNIRHSICQNQDTVYLGYAGSSGMNIQAYIQRINPSGTLPWGTNGVDFATQTTEMERVISIAIDEYSDGVWAIAEHTQQTQANVGEYVQKIDKTTGARLLGANAKVIFAVSSLDRSHRGDLQLDNGLPFFLISDGNSNGVVPKDLLLIELDAYGNMVASSPMTPMATNPNGTKGRIDFLEIWNHEAVAVWTEDRTGTLLPYAQSVSISPCLPPTAGFFATPTGLNVDFTNTGSSADSVYWDFGDGTSISDTSLTVSHTFANTGNYTVCQYVFGECGSDTTCSSIIACVPVQAQFSYYVSSSTLDTFYFYAQGVLGDSLFWDFGDGTILSTTQDTVTHVFASYGVYNVQLTVFNICSQDSISDSVMYIPENISEFSNAQAYAYPIPTRDYLNVHWIHTGNAEGETLVIYNLEGKLLKSIPVPDLNRTAEALISVGDLSDGTYILQGKTSLFSIRFTVQK